MESTDGGYTGLVDRAYSPLASSLIFMLSSSSIHSRSDIVLGSIGRFSTPENAVNTCSSSSSSSNSISSRNHSNICKTSNNIRKSISGSSERLIALAHKVAIEILAHALIKSSQVKSSQIKSSQVKSSGRTMHLHYHD